MGKSFRWRITLFVDHKSGTMIHKASNVASVILNYRKAIALGPKDVEGEKA
ncbi:MAG: hypothetical protein IPK50_13990 [Fibrobacterota bacterium]|nr:MAG: hypothetical protein IPK50_13990 [Fibrobacterota bacterium]